MKLKELLHGLDVLELHADEALDITGVQYDSCLLYTSPSPRDA